MKKIIQKISFCLLILLIIISSTSFSIKANDIKSFNTHISLHKPEITPTYITDNFFWSHTSQFTTWSYNEEGDYIKFKVPRPNGGERTFRVWAYTYNAEKLKSYIQEITRNEYTVVSGSAGIVIFLVQGMASGGISLVGTGLMLNNAGNARAALDRLNTLYPEAANFAERNF